MIVVTAEIVVVRGRGGRRGGGIHGGRGGERDRNGKKADEHERTRIIDSELLLLFT